MKNILRRIGILLVLILGFLVATLAVTILSGLAEEIPRITPEELKKMIESEADIVIVDNQPKGLYDKAHILGAVNLPWAMEIKGPVYLPHDKLLILYCGCAHEEDSASVADQLIEKFGYNNIKLLEGGWLQWVKLDYPIEKK
jgi:3-mercaptopyruvate sulfurtransferase SseA